MGNFLEIQKIKRPQQLSKFLGGLLLLVSLGTGIAVYSVGIYLFDQHNITISGRLIPFDISGLSSVQAGDVIIDQPRIEPPALPKQVGELPPPENFSAVSILVKDKETGAVLYQKNPYEPRSIASITKLMSALVVLEKQGDWSATTTVVTDALVDSHMVGQDIYTRDELWNSALIGSSNKAIMTIADSVGWEREAFVARMNERAVELGMSDTHFVEPTGLDAGNISTASDISLLLAEALRQDRIVQSLLTPEYTLYSTEKKSNSHMWNTNWLLLGWVPHSFQQIIGGKTGYIDASLYNFTVQILSDEGQALEVVVLGAKTHEARFTEARDVVQAVVDAYIWPHEEDYAKE